jgi:putative membrane protein
MHLWLKALHLIAMVAWFAGLFYMFRLFVYHAENRDEPKIVALLTVMERRLYRAITTPAMIATAIFGLAMIAWTPGLLRLHWLQAKIALVAGLIVYHLHVGRVRRRFEAGDVYLTSAQCRIRNEIPTLFLIAIVLLAVLRPGR